MAIVTYRSFSRHLGPGSRNKARESRHNVSTERWIKVCTLARLAASCENLGDMLLTHEFPLPDDRCQAVHIHVRFIGGSLQTTIISIPGGVCQCSDLQSRYGPV